MYFLPFYLFHCKSTTKLWNNQVLPQLLCKITNRGRRISPTASVFHPIRLVYRMPYRLSVYSPTWVFVTVTVSSPVTFVFISSTLSHIYADDSVNYTLIVFDKSSTHNCMFIPVDYAHCSCITKKVVPLHLQTAQRKCERERLHFVQKNRPICPIIAVLHPHKWLSLRASRHKGITTSSG